MIHVNKAVNNKNSKKKFFSWFYIFYVNKYNNTKNNKAHRLNYSKFKVPVSSLRAISDSFA